MWSELRSPGVGPFTWHALILRMDGQECPSYFGYNRRTVSLSPLPDADRFPRSVFGELISDTVHPCFQIGKADGFEIMSIHADIHALAKRT